MALLADEVVVIESSTTATSTVLGAGAKVGGPRE